MPESDCGEMLPNEKTSMVILGKVDSANSTRSGVAMMNREVETFKQYVNVSPRSVRTTQGHGLPQEHTTQTGVYQRCHCTQLRQCIYCDYHFWGIGGKDCDKIVDSNSSSGKMRRKPIDD
jgi:hypothetical protein